jgi:hypothetical protein
MYSPFFSLQNAVCFIILTYLVPLLFTFYIQDVLKLHILKLHFIYLFNKYRYSLFPSWYVLSFFFSSKCSSFHNSNVFGSCIIHILYKVKGRDSSVSTSTEPPRPTHCRYSQCNKFMLGANQIHTLQALCSKTN